ncbi:MAG TPA: hypothetical protein VMJ66_11315 [Geobacteraceae bacterium]|nr:hypothetical protein [Geobacteraceae bacterium]
MIEIRQIRPSKGRKTKNEEEAAPTAVSAEKKKKLKELDQFIEGVLAQAGEEFLEDFRQLAGE